MRVGILASTAGSTFYEMAAANPYPQIDFFMITDRACDAEEKARRLDIPYQRIENPDSAAFSAEAAKIFKEQGVDKVLTFFTRLLTADLYEALECINIHPSLLPAYPGLNAVAQAYNDRVDQLGATLLRVDGGVDTGQKIRTIASTTEGLDTLERWQNLSFTQTCWLGFYLLQGLHKGNFKAVMIENQLLIDRFEQIKRRNNVQYIL